jgi:S-adenosylmethionine hydrolase
MGREIHDFNLGHFPVATNLGDKISGQIVHIDRFGNLISNVPVEWVENMEKDKSITVRVGEYQLRGMAPTFQTESGRGLQAYPDSSGFVGFSIFKANAATQTGLKKGDLVEIF